MNFSLSILTMGMTSSLTDTIHIGHINLPDFYLLFIVWQFRYNRKQNIYKPSDLFNEQLGLKLSFASCDTIVISD